MIIAHLIHLGFFSNKNEKRCYGCNNHLVKFSSLRANWRLGFKTPINWERIRQLLTMKRNLKLDFKGMMADHGWN